MVHQSKAKSQKLRVWTLEYWWNTHENSQFPQQRFNLCDYPIQNHLFLFFSFPFLRFSKLFVHHHRRQRKPLPLSKARPYSSNLHYTTLSWYILYYILIILFVLLFKKVINLVALINAMWLGTLVWLES